MCYHLKLLNILKRWGCGKMNNVTLAFMLTILAGLTTGLGGLLVMFSKTTNKKMLCVYLSFAAGAMLYLSFAEVLFESFEILEYSIATVAFFVGVALMAIVDKLIPHEHEDEKELQRTGIMSFLAVAIHNFPEGFVTFVATMHNPALGIAIAIAISIHNIPEGIAIATPIYHATGSKVKAVGMSVLSGLTEPLGAIAAWIVLQRVTGDLDGLFGVVFAVVGGIMVFVAIHQLLPVAQKHCKHHTVMKWLFSGMIAMAISLVALEFLL